MHFVLFLFSPDILTTLDKENLATEGDQLSISLNQSQALITNLTEELHELQSRYYILGKNNSRLEVELKKVKDKATGETSYKINRSLSLDIAQNNIFHFSIQGWTRMIMRPDLSGLHLQ